MPLETKDLYARSLLNGKRWNPEANKEYVMPKAEFDATFGQNDLEAIKPIVAYFVGRHYMIDQPRITKLQRYYLGDNDIHYWVNNKKSLNHADNRIASGFPKFISNMRVGYMLGEPIQFKLNNEDDQLAADKATELLDTFNQQNDEEYHEKAMKINLSTTGRAYELLYAGKSVQQDGHWLTPDVKLRAVDPATAFVVYDTSIDRHSLFGVRYYTIDYNGSLYSYVDVYTADVTYHYEVKDGPNSNGGDYTLTSQETTSFGAVPLTEYINNENKTGDWEAKLDQIDAYDLAMSEMANSEEDFANAKLMIKGDIDFSDSMVTLTDASGEPLLDDQGEPIKVPKIDAKDPYIMLKPSIIPNDAGGTTVIDSDASYLTKQLNETGWQAYINQLISDIHKDTNTPDTTDNAFSGQSSGVALMYKLFGEDQERTMQQSLYTRGLMRRLRLLGNYWRTNREISDASLMDDFKPVYTPNLPRNNADLVNMLVQLSNSGLFSDRTLREFGEKVTGVDADTEEKRMDDEKPQDYEFNGAPLQGANPADVEAARQQLADQGITEPHQPNDPGELFRQMRHGAGTD